MVRGCRCAPPPATFWQASDLRDSRCNTSECYSTHLCAFDPEQRCKLLQFVRDVAYADSTVMGGAVNVPFIDEPSRANRETIATVGVANLQDRTWNRFSFSDEQLQTAV